MRWSRSPVVPGGELGDTVLFPWRSGDDALGSTLDEPSPARAAPEIVASPFSADLALLLARVVVGLLAVLGGGSAVLDLPRGVGRGATETLLAVHGFGPVATLTTVLGWAALVGGVLLGLGVFASVAAGVLLAAGVAALGVEIPVALAAGSPAPLVAPVLAATLLVILVLAGPGRISADAGRAWARARAQTPVGLTCVLLAVVTGLTVLVAYR